MSRGNVKVRIDAENNTDRGVRGAERDLERLGGLGGKIGGKFKAGLLGAGAALVGLAEGAHQAIEEVEDLGTATIRFSRITGADNEVSSEWVEQAKVRGIEAQKLNTAFLAYSKQVTAAAHGTKASVQAFKELGVSQEIVKSGNFDKTIAAVSDGLAKLPNGAEKSALAQKLFGKQAQLLMPLLQDGSKALNEQLNTAKKYGAVIGDETVEKVKESAEAQRNLKLAMDGLKVTVGTALLPILDKVIGTFAKLVQGIRTGEGQFGQLHTIFLTTGHVIATVFGTIGRVIGDAQRAISTWVSRNKADISDFLGDVRKIAAVVGEVFDGVVIPIIRRLLPIVKTVFDGFVTAIRGAVRLVTGILTLDLGKAWDGVKDLFSGGVKIVVGLFKASVAPIAAVAKSIARALSGTIGGAWDTLKSVVRDVVQFMKDRLADVLGFFQKILEAASHVPIIGDKFRKAAEGIQAMRDDLYGLSDAARQAVTNVNAITDAANRARDAANLANNLAAHGIHQAAGGKVPGTGSGDIVPAMLEPGEWTIRKAAVQKFGDAFMASINAGVMPAVQRFAGGGRAKKPKVTQLDRLQRDQALAELTHPTVDDVREATRQISYWRGRLSHAKSSHNVLGEREAAQELLSARDNLATLKQAQRQKIKDQAAKNKPAKPPKPIDLYQSALAKLNLQADAGVFDDPNTKEDETAAGLSAAVHKLADRARGGAFGQLSKSGLLQVSADERAAAAGAAGDDDTSQKQLAALQQLVDQGNQRLDLEKQRGDELARALATSQAQYPALMAAITDAVNGMIGGRVGPAMAAAGPAVRY